eukprot:15482246-Alexandrium_andersonii.AAC.1
MPADLEHFMEARGRWERLVAQYNQAVDVDEELQDSIKVATIMQRVPEPLRAQLNVQLNLPGQRALSYDDLRALLNQYWAGKRDWQVLSQSAMKDGGAAMQ